MSPEQLRPVLIISLLFVVFLMWEAWQRDYGPKPTPQTQTETSPGSTVGAAGAPDSARHDVPQLPQAAEPASQPAQSGAPGAASAPATQTTIETDLLRVQLDASGNLVHGELLKYPKSLEDASPFELLNNQLPNIFTAQTGLVGSEGAPSHYTAFSTDRDEYRLADGADSLVVPLRWQSDNGITVEKRLTFRRDSYVVTIDYQVKNGSPDPWSARLYSQFKRTQVAGRTNMFATYTYTGGVISSPDKPYEKIDFSDMVDADLSKPVTGGWVAMIQHYFAGAWIPNADNEQLFYSRALEGAQYNLGLYGRSQTVAPGGSADYSIKLYVGPKIQKRLEAAAPGLGRTVDYGWLWFIAQPLHIALSWIHDLFGNWGIAIIVLTLIIKAVFFHLSATSYKSMARMRKLQPRMAQLKERYGDDRARMNQAMMELYKTEKINPLGGCLPILVQIPVFISLYWTLLESVELRMAPFFGWIQDLSVQDPIYVLPILMGISMFVQQRLNPTPPDPIQAKVMMALPFIFTFFFLFFPSGLVLYWVVNNVLSIAQQWVITRKIVGPDEPPAK